MNFYDWKTQYDKLKGVGCIRPNISRESFLAHVWNRSEHNLSISGTYWACVCAEDKWMESCRPYYKVWPSFIDALSRVPFSVKCESLCPPIPCVAIRFSIGNSSNVSAAFIEFHRQDYARGPAPVGSLQIAVYNKIVGEEYPATKAIVVYPGESVTDSMAHPPTITMENGEVIRNVVDGEFKPNEEEVRADEFALRVALALCLFANDPDFFQPDVLADDRRKFDESTDPELRQRLIDKARKRGIVGWRIGEQYETIPHYRRPHFGLRWTEKGRMVPRIVPVKGSIVHREKLTEVPTGYITPDGKEIEP